MGIGNSLNISQSGLVAFDGTSVFSGRTITAGAGISITNANGVSGNPTISSSLTFPLASSLGGTGANNTATSGTVLRGNGSAFVPTTATYPNTAGTSGKILISDGTNIVSSTPTYPNTATGTGTILRADGTNWAATTSTYPNTNAVNTLLYASSANVMGALATANSGVLTTDASGVPSIDTTNFVRQTTGMQIKGNNAATAPPAGFIGEQLTANASAVALLNNTAKTVTSISLTAGVWDVSGTCHITNTGAFSSGEAGISTTNNTVPAGNSGVTKQTYIPGAAQALGGTPYTLGVLRAVLSGATTYYMIGLSVFSGGTASANAYITATRVG